VSGQGAVYDYGSDIYTEADGSDDTLANLGPLRSLAGVWTSADGADIHPVGSGSDITGTVVDSDEHNVFTFQTVSFRMRVTAHPDGTWSYEEHTTLRIPGRLRLWTPGASEELLAVARATRAPATVQNIGSTMRSLVTFAYKHRWLSRDDDPMWRVSYSPQPQHQGQVVGYIPRDSLPTDEQCNALFAALTADGHASWALAMRLKHRSGLRWGELICLAAARYRRRTASHRARRTRRRTVTARSPREDDQEPPAALQHLSSQPHRPPR
jgi:hypothetical protein